MTWKRGKRWTIELSIERFKFFILTFHLAFPRQNLQNTRIRHRFLFRSVPERLEQVILQHCVS